LKKILNKRENVEKKEDIEQLKLQSKNNSKLYKQKQIIFNDVYDTIKKEHYNRETISDIDLIE